MTLSITDRLLLPLRLARARKRLSFRAHDEFAAAMVVDGFATGFPEGEVAYNGLGLDDRGHVALAISTKVLDAGARLFTFDPLASSLTHAADLDVALSSGSARTIPQGKVHVDLVAIGEHLFGATHVGYYRPGLSLERTGTAEGFDPYPGGWFFAVEHGRIAPLAQAPAGEGIITMSADTARHLLFGLTWPSGHLLSLDLDRNLLRNVGPVLGAGETGSTRDGSWTRICRSLAVHPPSGAVFWSDGNGRISRFDGHQIEIVTSTPRSEMWRKVVWHPEQQLFYGVLWNSAMLFRFDPVSLRCEEIGTLRVPGAGDRTPATLGLCLSEDGRTLHALGTGPGMLRPGRLPLAATVSHLTCDLASMKTSVSGPLQLPDGRWITQAQSLLLSDGIAYSLCWVEVPEDDRSDHATTVRRWRRRTSEYRSRGYAEEIQLVRYPLPR